MRNFLIVFFITNFCFAQSVDDRIKIRSSYNYIEINKLKKRFENNFLFQQKLIKDFKKQNRIEESDQLSLQRIYDGFPIFFSVNNDESAKTIRANELYVGGSLGLNLSGSKIVAGVWDGGKVRSTHREFSENKITLGDNHEALSNHATHVTGTIVSTGIDPRSKGIAYNSSAKTFYWDSDIVEMTAFGADGYLVSNHSYGYTITGFPNWRFGSYDQTSLDFDLIAELLPYYQIVVSAGNSRNSSHTQVSLKQGYDLLTGSTLSKNCLTVAAVNYVPEYNSSGSVVMSSFSNFGPPDDGRIKPDISAKGVNVYSTVSTSDDSYDGTYSGTSMAAPAITGMVALLQEFYHKLNGRYMKAATVRGLICHTADEAGFNEGPDYEYGWGLANAVNAAKVVSNKSTSSIIEERLLLDKEIFQTQFSINQTQDFSVSLTWTDPAGTVNKSGEEDNRIAKLINDLDLVVIKDGQIFYPWKLDPLEPNKAATNISDNVVDNIEKVYIKNALPGTYQIKVTHKGSLLKGDQEFSLIADAASGLTLSSKDFSIEKSIQIYPNPAQDFVSFSLPSEFNLKYIKVYDVLGKEVLSTNEFSNNQLRIGSLNKGLYLISFVGDNASVTSKFIKE
nr:S8 family serine peptidase [uncultured Flavobacterium sp.]